MKMLIALFLVLGQLVFAGTFSVNKRVLLRIPDTQKTHIQERILDGLLFPDRYESRYFKIVLGTNETAISINHPDQVLQLKAATVYYHLTKAQRYWVTELKSQRARQLHQIVVRLDMTRGFSDIAHYTSENMEPEFNNALTVPAGNPPDFVPNGKPWKEEIWFRPKKKILTSTLDIDFGSNPLTKQLQQLQGPIQDYAVGQFQTNTLQALFWDRYKGPYWQELVWLGGTFAVMKVIVEASKRMDRLFLDKWYYLDTALVPEVIFHEYAHVILSDYLTLSHSTAVIEGMADYFAAVIAAWKVKQAMPHKANELIYNARKYLRTDSATIYDSFLRAILRSCNDVCEKPLRDRNILYQVFTKKGL